jgi:hypothetical protein
VIFVAANVKINYNFVKKGAKTYPMREVRVFVNKLKRRHSRRDGLSKFILFSSVTAPKDLEVWNMHDVVESGCECCVSLRSDYPKRRTGLCICGEYRVLLEICRK